MAVQHLDVQLPTTTTSIMLTYITYTVSITAKNAQHGTMLFGAGLNNVVLLTLFTVVNSIVQHCYTRLRADSDATVLFNIVDNCKQCGQQNIAQYCYTVGINVVLPTLFNSNCCQQYCSALLHLIQAQQFNIVDNCEQCEHHIRQAQSF